MAYSYVELTASGSSDLFGFSFGYLDAAHIHVYVDGVEDEDYSWNNSSTVQLSFTPDADATVLIRRSTPRDARLVDFEDGSMLTEANLDKDANHAFYVMQEAFDSLAGLITVDDADGKLDAQSLTIKNVAALEGAVVTQLAAYVTDSETAETAAELAQSLAEAARDLAQAAKTAAELAETNAETAETNADASAVAAAASAAAAAASAIEAAGGTHDHDDDYYTETEADARFVRPDVADSFTAAQAYTKTTKSGTSVTVDASDENYAELTLSGNTTINALANKSDGRCGFLRVIQAAGGYTLSFNAEWEFTDAAVPEIGTTAGDEVCISWFVVGTSVRAAVFYSEEA